MTYQTNSKLYIRDDGEAGLQVFSPFTGLLYNVPTEDKDEVLDWLEARTLSAPKHYMDTLGLLWATPFEEVAKKELIHAPSASNVAINRLLVINWLITGKCTHKCTYCYAADMQNIESCMVTIKDINKMIGIVLSYSPLAVVISGGEPLLHPHFRAIIERLKGKTGIILDTNGFLLTENDVDFLKANDVVVRISIDSLIEKNDQKTRLACEKRVQTHNLKIVLNAVELCLRKDVALVVHTVVTAANKNDLLSMGEKLYCLGVRVWKIMRLVDIGTIETKSLKVSYRSSAHFLAQIKHSVNLMWKERMRVIVQENDPLNLNATVLLSPDGQFLTQSVSGEGKVPLDPERPYRPREKEILKRLNMWEHKKRYMGE